MLEDWGNIRRDGELILSDEKALERNAKLITRIQDSSLDGDVAGVESNWKEISRGNLTIG